MTRLGDALIAECRMLSNRIGRLETLHNDEAANIDEFDKFEHRATEDIAHLKDQVQNNAIDIESIHQRVLHLEGARYGEKSEEVPKLNPDFLAKGQAFERVQQDHAPALDALARVEAAEETYPVRWWLGATGKGGAFIRLMSDGTWQDRCGDTGFFANCRYNLDQADDARFQECTEDGTVLYPWKAADELRRLWAKIRQLESENRDLLARVESRDSDNNYQADRIGELEAELERVSSERKTALNQMYEENERAAKEKFRADTLSEMLRGMARRATHERRMIGRFSFSTPEHPDLIDRDGDRWQWSRHHGAYQIANGLSDVATRDEMEMYYGPVREAE